MDILLSMRGCPPFVFIVELLDTVSVFVRSTLIIKINHWRYLMVHGFEHQTEEIQIKQGALVEDNYSVPSGF